jgi:hypothetical protein
MLLIFLRNLFDAINIIADIMIVEVIIRDVIVVNNYINTCLSKNYIALLEVMLKYRKIFAII